MSLCCYVTRIIGFAEEEKRRCFCCILRGEEDPQKTIILPRSSSTFLEFLPDLLYVSWLSKYSSSDMPKCYLHIPKCPLQITKIHLAFMKILLHFTRFHPPFTKMMLLIVLMCSKTIKYPPIYQVQEPVYQNIPLNHQAPLPNNQTNPYLRNQTTRQNTQNYQ